MRLLRSKKALVVILGFAIICACILYVKISAQKIPVLLYHHLLKDDENKNFRDNGMVISVEQFEEEMEYLYDNGFHTVDSNDMERFLYDKQSLPEKSVWITFDDGYLSNIIYAYPILKKYGFKATVFVVTSYTTDYPGQFNPDNLDVIGTADFEGTYDVFEYASHTDNMHRYGKNKRESLLRNASRGDIIKDIRTSFSKDYINCKDSFSYPFGLHNGKATAVLKELGVRTAVTVRNGYVRKNSNPLLLDRLFIGPGLTAEKFGKMVNTNLRI